MVEIVVRITEYACGHKKHTPVVYNYPRKHAAEHFISFEYCQTCTAWAIGEYLKNKPS